MTESNNLWKINNKAWVKARQTRWTKKILPQLKEMMHYWDCFLQPCDLPYLKAYFLKGELLNYDEKWFKKLDYVTQLEPQSREMIGTPYQILLIFKVWFYPEDDQDLFELWCKRSRPIDVQIYEIAARNPGSEGNKGCEFFAGRSYYLDRYLVPKTFDDYVESIDELSSRPEDFKQNFEKQSLMLRKWLLADIISQKISCLVGRGRFPYVFCHELFVDLLTTVDFCSEAPNDGRTYELMFKAVMNLILHKKNKDFDPKHPLIEKLKSEMIEQFEGGITPEIDALWQEAQKGPFSLS